MDILITEDLDAPAIRRLGEKYDLVRDATLWKEAARLRDTIGQARAIMVRNQTQVSADLLAAAPNLIGVGRLGVGLDNIDVPAASKIGVVVIAPLDANATSVAELTIGFILSLARKIPHADRSTKAGGWNRKNCTGIELQGKTLAICGFGRIGRLVAVRARAFGMQVLAFDPFIKADSPVLIETGARLCVQLEEALAGADFVTAHSPLTPETRRMFNARTFGVMKPGSFFINTSRGGIVDESALLEALRRGHLGGAALDVRDVEPPNGPSGFEAMENVILTPHIGSFTGEAQTRTFEAVAADIDRLLSGEPAINFVNFGQPRR
jgi:D-3-phosphoglycerate dehydrogenase